MVFKALYYKKQSVFCAELLDHADGQEEGN